MSAADRAVPEASAQVVKRAPGRPRLEPKKLEGKTTREEILEVAAKLFAEQGYTETTTRQIAEAVGIKQASLYYHFADKGSIVRALLAGTVSPSVAFAAWLGERDLAPEVKLYALARFDLDVILSDPWNMHILFRLPDISRRDEVGSREGLTVLRDDYRQLAVEVASSAVDSEALMPDVDLVFGLVEGIVAQRYWGDLKERSVYAGSVARGCLRLLRVPEAAIVSAEAQTATVLAEYAAL